MLPRVYEIYLVMASGTKIQGPVFPQANYNDFKAIADKAKTLESLRFTFNNYVANVPKQALHDGVVVIRRIGYFRALLKAWRYRA